MLKSSISKISVEPPGIVSGLSFKCISDTLDRCADGFFCGRAFDGEGVGRSTGLGFLNAWQILDGTDYGCLAMAAMHVLDTVNCHIGVSGLLGGKLAEKLHHKSKYN